MYRKEEEEEHFTPLAFLERIGMDFIIGTQVKAEISYLHVRSQRIRRAGKTTYVLPTIHGYCELLKYCEYQQN